MGQLCQIFTELSARDMTNGGGYYSLTFLLLDVAHMMLNCDFSLFSGAGGTTSSKYKVRR